MHGHLLIRMTVSTIDAADACRCYSLAMVFCNRTVGGPGL